MLLLGVCVCVHTVGYLMSQLWLVPSWTSFIELLIYFSCWIYALYLVFSPTTPQHHNNSLAFFANSYCEGLRTVYNSNTQLFWSQWLCWSFPCACRTQAHVHLCLCCSGSQTAAHGSSHGGESGGGELRVKYCVCLHRASLDIVTSILLFIQYQMTQ